jgi:hypothetical protein
MPVLVLERFGEDPALLGWIWGAWGLGAVLGNAISFRTVASSDRLLIASIGEAAMIAPLWLLLVDLPAAVLIAALAVSGLANGIGNPPVHTIFTLRTPRALRAKVWSVVIAATSVLSPVALVGAGAVFELEGALPVIFALVLVQTAAAIAFCTAGLRERARLGEPVTA